MWPPVDLPSRHPEDLLSRSITLLITILLVAGCASTPTPNAPGSAGNAVLATTVSVAEAAALRDQGAFVLDVREPDEWTAGHIPGATLIPLGELAGRTDEVPGDQPIVVVCRSGNRSAEGRDILLGAGFPTVTSLDGGVTDWARAGMPIETGA
jgi:rhodanese-related sulfurtransferase